VERWLIARAMKQRLEQAQAELASGSGNAGELQDQIAAYGEILGSLAD
jgi:hypothetical protein